MTVVLYPSTPNLATELDPQPSICISQQSCGIIPSSPQYYHRRGPPALHFAAKMLYSVVLSHRPPYCGRITSSTPISWRYRTLNLILWYYTLESHTPVSSPQLPYPGIEPSTLYSGIILLTLYSGIELSTPILNPTPYFAAKLRYHTIDPHFTTEKTPNPQYEAVVLYLHIAPQN